MTKYQWCIQVHSIWSLALEANHWPGSHQSSGHILHGGLHSYKVVSSLPHCQTCSLKDNAFFKYINVLVWIICYWMIIQNTRIIISNYTSGLGYRPYAGDKHPGILNVTLSTYIAYKICHLLLCTHVHVLIFRAQTYLVIKYFVCGFH